MDWQDHIIFDQDVLSGKPSIKGTRVSVEHLIDLLAQGWSDDQILVNYPRLNKENLKAISAYLRASTPDNCIKD